ncbi:MAG: hypothetical protein AB7V01_17295, partial [Vicinamibacterales bacterium]
MLREPTVPSCPSPLTGRPHGRRPRSRGPHPPRHAAGRPWRPSPLWLAALVLLPVVTQAQEPAAPDAPTRLVLDVAVLDADGRQVPTLGPADFVVTTDGESRRVVSAEYVRLEGREAGSAPTAPADAYFTSNRTAGPGGRFVLFLVDEAHLHADRADAGLSVVAALLDALGPADRIALVAVPAPGVFVDFTTDRDAIREGLRSVIGRARDARTPFTVSDAEARALAGDPGAPAATRAIARECGSAASPAERDTCQRDLVQHAGERVIAARDTARQSLRGLRDVLVRLAPIDGPKSAVLLSEGFVVDGLSRDVEELAATAAEVQASLDVLVVPPAGNGEGPAAAGERAQAAAGLDTVASLARGNLVPLADPPGGTVAGLRQALEGYFLLTVDARPGDLDGPRHRLAVGTTREGLRVRARGPFRIPARAAPASPAEAVEQALQALVPHAGVPLRLATWTFREPGGTGVRLMIDAEAELPADNASVTTGIIVVDDDGKVRTRAVEERHLPRHTRDPGIAIYSAAVTVTPGRYRVRFALADARGRVGAVDRMVDAASLPDDGLAASDLLVAAAPVGGAGALAPTVEARIVDEPLAALLEVYPAAAAALADVTVTLDVIRTETGEPLVSQPMDLDTAAAPGIGTARAVVDTAELSPGRYLARATVRQAGEERARRTRPFLVTPSAAGGRPRAGSGGRMA